MERNFTSPTAFRKNPKTGYLEVDKEKSELCRLLEAYGRPKVYYGAKINKYFKDPKFTNPYADSEIQSLGLPIPAEIQAARKKMIEAALKEGTSVDMDEVLNKTSPSTLEPPPEVKARLVQVSPADRLISRVNRSTLGK